MDVIDSLLSIEEQLTTWLFAASATSAQEQAKMKRVLALRDKFAAQTNQIVLQRLQLAGLDIAKPAAALDAVNDKLESIAKDIAAVQDIIGLISDAVAAAAAIIALF